MYDGQKIKVLREGKGWSQTELAKEASVSQPTISDLENQEFQDPGHETLMRVAVALGVPLSEIMGRPDPNNNDISGQMSAIFARLDLGNQEAIVEAAKALLRRQK